MLSIHLFSSALYEVGSQRQQSEQWRSHIPVHTHFSLFWGDRKVFPVQPLGVVPPVCPRSFPGPPPQCAWKTSWGRCPGGFQNRCLSPLSCSSRCDGAAQKSDTETASQPTLHRSICQSHTPSIPPQGQEPKILELLHLWQRHSTDLEKASHLFPVENHGLGTAKTLPYIMHFN